MTSPGYLRFVVAGDSGIVSIDPAGRLGCGLGDLRLHIYDSAGDTVYQAGAADGPISAAFSSDYATDGSMRIFVTLKNVGDAPIRLSRAVFESADKSVAIQGDMSGWARYKMGFNTGAASGAAPLTVPDNRFFLRGVPYGILPKSVTNMLYYDGTEFSKEPGKFESEWFSALYDFHDKHGILFGFYGVQKHFSRVRVDLTAGTASLTAFLDDSELAPGATRELDPIIILYGSDLSEMLEQYANAVAEHNQARVNPAAIWCSWYSGFYDRVKVSDIRDNMQALSKIESPVRFIQLDDGYQAMIGDWLNTNSRFPDGVEALAKEISQAGFNPGIWTAPFSVSPEGSVYKQHPDWVVRNSRGKPVKAGFIMGRFGPRPYYALDTTIPEVRAHVTGIYKSLRKMGWRLFKIDFLTSAMIEGVRKDPSRTRAEAYRMGMQAVRDGVGEDGLILTGIGPFLINTGIIDIQRLSPDTCFGSPAWMTLEQKLTGDRMTPGVRNQTSTCIGRAFTNDILWSGDADAIVGPGLAPNEAVYLKTVALLTGSTLTIGHDFRKAPFDFSGYDHLLAARGPARVVDMGQVEFPRHLIRAATIDSKPVKFYAVLNQSDSEVSIPVSEEIFVEPFDKVDDYWNGTEVEMRPDVSFKLGPRSARLFVIWMASKSDAAG